MALLTEISNYLWVEQLGQFGGRKHKWKCLLFHRLPEFCPGSGCHIQAKQGKWPESDIRSSISASQWGKVSQQACEPQRCVASKSFETDSSGRFRRFSCIYNLSRPAPVTGEAANKKINICENTQWLKTELECFPPLSRGGGRLHKGLTTKATTYKEDSSNEEKWKQRKYQKFLTFVRGAEVVGSVDCCIKCGSRLSSGNRPISLKGCLWKHHLCNVGQFYTRRQQWPS